MQRINDLFEILTEKKKLEIERVELNTILSELKLRDIKLYKSLKEIDKQLSLGKFDQSNIIIELNKKNEIGHSDQLENIFQLLITFHTKKIENNGLFKQLIILFRCINETHEYLYGMLDKQKKLSKILKEVKSDIEYYFYYNISQQKIDINLLIELCEKLGAFFPYPLLKNDLKNNDLFNLFSSHETYLIQLYLLFKNKEEQPALIDYLFMQIQLGLLYENNAYALNNFIKNHQFSSIFLNKHDINSQMSISQLLIEPVQYFPRFILLLNKLIEQLKLFNLNHHISYIKMLIFVRDKIEMLGQNLNKFLNCHSPEKIDLYFLKKTIKESIGNNNNKDNTSHLIEQTLRTDKLHILNEYMQLFYLYLNAYQNQYSYYLSLFSSGYQETEFFIKEWNKFSPECIKIFNENQHKKEKPSLIFQQGIIKLYEKAIGLLVHYYGAHSDDFVKGSLGHFIMGYILNLEETLSKITNNQDDAAMLTNISIEIHLEKAGKDNIERKNKYEYYKSLYEMINYHSNHQAKINIK